MSLGAKQKKRINIGCLNALSGSLEGTMCFIVNWWWTVIGSLSVFCRGGVSPLMVMTNHLSRVAPEQWRHWPINSTLLPPYTDQCFSGFLSPKSFVTHPEVYYLIYMWRFTLTRELRRGQVHHGTLNFPWILSIC